MSDAIDPTPAAPAEAVAEAPAAKAPEAEPVFELEIDGKKETLTHTQARTRLQKSGALDKRFQETAETKKKLDALFAEFEADPEAALRKAGKDPEKILEGLLARKAKLALLTPEQKEALALKEERDALKAKADATEKEKKEAADKESDARHETALREQLVGVAEKYNLDHAPEALEGLCDVAIDLMEMGFVPSLDQIAQEYMKRDTEHIEARDRKLLPTLKGERLKSYLKANVDRMLAMPAAELLDILGPEGVKAIQAATLSKLPTPGAVKVKAAPIAPPPRNGAGRFVTEAAFDKKFSR